MRKLPLAALIVLASCASNWTFVGAREQPALQPGVQLATFERGRGAEREHRVEIRTSGGDSPVKSLDALMQYVRPLDNPDAAIAYADLVRDLGLAESGVIGLSVRPDPNLTGAGGSGRYSRSDAAGWGVPFEPSARPFGGGFEVTHVVLLKPAQNAFLEHVSSPWKLVYVSEVVSPDGTIRPVDAKTLSNGDDAARFAGY